MRTIQVAFLALLAVGLANPAAGQWNPISFSVKGGVDYSTLNVENSSHQPDYLLAYGGGISLGTQVGRNAAIDIDLLYARKGASEEYVSGNDKEGEPITTETNLDFVIVSPRLRLSPGHYGSGVYFFGGPEFGYLVNAKTKVTRGGDDELLQEGDVDYYKDTEFGASAGMGFTTASNGDGGFFIEGRYAMGFSNLVDESAWDEQWGAAPSHKTRAVYVMAGLTF